MKITGSIRSTYVKPTRAAATTGKAEATQAKGDRVGVSSLAKQIASARSPEVPDEARIERLREAIDHGTFEIDHDKIAEQMLLEEVD